MDRTHLPSYPEKFDGSIGQTYADSTPGNISLTEPPAGAPNVVVIMLDDVGFGQTSPFGGPAQMPNLERLAAEGLTYNRFHTTALCSPTRAPERTQPPQRSHGQHHGARHRIPRIRRPVAE